MLADIQSQIELIDDQSLLPECYDLTSEDVEKLQIRKASLECVMGLDVSEIDQDTIELIYGE